METSPSESAPERSYKFRDGIRTDKGLRRSENQDNYGFAHTSRISLYLVCDGMGGARGGKVASAIAVNSILRSAFDLSGSINTESIRQAFEQTNNQIFTLSRAEKTLEGMGTTAVLLVLIGDKAIAAHVGDSRMYLLRDGKLSRVTRDHTIVQDLVDSGAITATDAGKHPLAHMLTRSLGPAETVEAEIRELDEPVKSGDRFLVCCDGLYNHVTDPEIEEILRDNEPDQAAEVLLQRALAGGGLDNITIEVIEPIPFSDSSMIIDYPAPGKVRVVVSNSDPTLERQASPESTLSLSIESLQGFDPEHLAPEGEESSRTGFFRRDDIAAVPQGVTADGGHAEPFARTGSTSGTSHDLATSYSHPSMDNLLRIHAEPVGFDDSNKLALNDDEEDDLIGELNLLRIAAILVVVFAIASVVVVLYRQDLPRVVSSLASIFSSGDSSSGDSDLESKQKSAGELEIDSHLAELGSRPDPAAADPEVLAANTSSGAAVENESEVSRGLPAPGQETVRAEMGTPAGAEDSAALKKKLNFQKTPLRMAHYAPK